MPISDMLLCFCSERLKLIHLLFNGAAEDISSISYKYIYLLSVSVHVSLSVCLSLSAVVHGSYVIRRSIVPSKDIWLSISCPIKNQCPSCLSAMTCSLQIDL